MMLDDYFSTFLLVQLHPGDQHATTWQTNRAIFYNLEYYPTAWFDGVENVHGGTGNTQADYNRYKAAYDLRRAITPDVTIELSGSQISGPEYQITATICIETGGSAKSMRIYMVQVLDHWPITPSYSRNGFKGDATTEDISLNPGECQQVVRNFTFDGDSPPMPFDDFPDNGETESASLFLGRKKGIENLFYTFLIDSMARILDNYSIVILLLIHFDRDGTAIRGGLNGVEKNV